jgi:squalene synthase HpnC
MVSNADAQAEHGRASPAEGLDDSVLHELERIAASGSRKITTENYPVALRLLPRGVRNRLVRVYGYARLVDDVGDQAGGDRLALLDAIDRDVQALPAGRPALAAVRGLTSLVRDDGLPIEPLRDLVEANRIDQLVTRYETFDDLLGYCRLSAAPIGRIVLAIAGCTDAAALARSDKVCAALQVLEHCQDVGEDAAAGRVYLPAADLRAAGVADDDLRAPATSAALRRVIALQVHRSEELLAAGGPLVRQLSGWSRLAVRGYVGGGRATAAALKRTGYEVLAQHVRPARLATVRYATFALGR